MTTAWIPSPASRHRRALSRERAVLSACAQLVAASKASDIERILVSAVIRVIDVPCSVIFVLDHFMASQRPSVSDVRSLARGEAFFVAASELSDGVRNALESGLVYDAFSPADLRWLAHQVGRDDRVRAARLVPLLLDGTMRTGFIVVAERPLSRDTVNAISTLASTCSIALSRSILEGRYSALVQSSTDMIGVIRPGFGVTYVSPSVVAFLAMDADEVEPGRVGEELLRRLHTDDRAHILDIARRASRGEQIPSTECRVRAQEGSWRHFDLTFANLIDQPFVEGVVITARDISARKDVESQLRHQALHDPLTALANGVLLRDRIEHALRHRRRAGSSTALLLLDLDEFKEINDSLGHQAGDQALLHVTERVLGCIREDDTFARLGGDEFAILLEDVGDPAEAEAIAERILDAIEAPIRLLRGDLVRLGASIGLVLDGDLGSGADEALRNADVAMYAAKRAGKRCARAFSETMHTDVVRKVRMEAALRQAIEGGRLTVQYQPIVAALDGSVIGVEALARWNDPERGAIPPGVFIPLAESSGLIVALGRCVLEEACRTMARWITRAPELADLQMSVNVSPIQLEARGFVEDVALILETSGIAPDRLTIEITEGALMREAAHAADRLQALRRLGVRVAIDDFGVGQSSIGRLQALPADQVKVDRSLVQGIASQPGGAAVLQSIVSLCRSLSLAMVIEGVEDEAELRIVRGVDPNASVQGFLFARPMDQADALPYVLAHPTVERVDRAEPRPAA
jgi:diguanylate cyclase (GGDEF)-like protein/PAS domain S-box-containing protein